MTLPFKLVSADSHVVEPPDLWTTRLDAKYRDRAPRIVSRPEGDFFVLQGGLGRDEHASGMSATKRKYDNPESYDFGHDNARWEGVPEQAYDPVERIKELDREGVEAELMYTSHGLLMYALKDYDFRYACMQAFNDWLGEFCSHSPKRLFGVGLIPTDDTDRAVAELERCAKMGFRGAMVSIDHGPGETYVDERYKKFWDAAEALDMPISLHTAASEEGSMFVTGSMFVNFSCGFTPTMYSIVSMIFQGLFDRHRKLKMISVENDASWALAVLERMDDRWLHDKQWAGATGLVSGRNPSEVFHDQVACSFMRDRTAIVNRDIIGKKNLMWGSDYPHFDGAWPDQAGRLERQFAGVPLEDQIRIGRTNAIDFYNLPIETPAKVAEPA